MPAAEPREQEIIEALESRKQRAKLLRQPKQHQYERAIEAIRSARGHITKLSHVSRLQMKGKCKQITDDIFNEIVKVWNGDAEVLVPMPSQAQQDKAVAEGRSGDQPLPGMQTGAATILLVLAENHTNGGRYMTIQEIRRRAAQDFAVDLGESTGLTWFTKWSAASGLEKNGWVKREAWSKRTFGSCVDELSITDKGLAIAARLETRIRQQPGLWPAAAATLARPGQHNASAAMSSRSQSSVAAFSGSSRVLGESREHNLRRAAAAAAAGLDGGNIDDPADPYFDEDLAFRASQLRSQFNTQPLADLDYDTDSDGFQIYRPEDFETDVTPVPAVVLPTPGQTAHKPKTLARMPASPTPQAPVHSKATKPGKRQRQTASAIKMAGDAALARWEKSHQGRKQHKKKPQQRVPIEVPDSDSEEEQQEPPQRRARLQ